MNDITKLYSHLTAPERLKITVDAMSRGDWVEAGRLGDTCPKFVYVAQRDLAYTGKFLNLQSIALLHAAFFWKCRGAMLAAMLTLDDGAYSCRYAELMAQVEAFERFCEFAGLDAETVLQAFGLSLDRNLIDDLRRGELEPDEAMIESMYQGHLRNWA